KYRSLRTNEPYPESKQRCDIAFGAGEEWLVEVKMARFSGDNGKPDDTSVKDILSPFENDRSAISDCIKLSKCKFEGRKAILIYGFNDKRRPLERIIGAFETLANSYVRLGVRFETSFGGLVHPVFESGGVFGWEIDP
ncbi:MAG TPA: hypothetical protein VNL38_02630, partial [Candidatus Nitrosotenuis sp.]|nr:hypothetical protein [Candidatus Nitrosotenuis sp.]